MAIEKTPEQGNINRLKTLVEELTIRDEKIFLEHGIFEQIVRLMLDGIWIIDENFKTVFVNDKICTMLGFTQSEILGDLFTNYLTRESDKEIIKKSIKNKQHGVEEHHIFQLKCKDNKLTPAMLTAAPLFAQKDNKYTSVILTTAPLVGQFRKYRGSIIYIKEITNEEILNYYKQMFFDVSIDALLVTDSDGIIQDVNHQYYTMLGYEKEEVMGQHFSKFICEADNYKSNQVFNELIMGKDLLEFENKLICKNNELLTVSWRAKFVLENGLIFATGRRLL